MQPRVRLAGERSRLAGESHVHSMAVLEVVVQRGSRMPASGVGTAEAARHPHELGTEGVRRGAPIAHAVAALAALDLHKQRVVGRQQQGALEVQVEAVLHVGLQLWVLPFPINSPTATEV